MTFSTHLYQKIDRDRIRNFRLKGVDGKSKPVSLEQLASEMGVSRNAIHKLENKKSHIPSVELIIRYCEHFKISLIEMLILEERKKMAANLANFFLQHDIIDYGSAQSMINFYSR